MIPDLVILGSWLAFLVTWIASAARLKPVAERQPIRQALMYRLPFMLGVFLLFFSRLSDVAAYQLTPHSLATGTAAAVLSVLGLFTAIWARFTLAGNWSTDVTFKKDHTLIETGPYRFARHPIYTGLSLMFAGTALVAGRAGTYAGALLCFFALCIKLRFEERLLERHFPEYGAYKARVKAIIPFIL